jgi:hypothetical protein
MCVEFSKYKIVSNHVMSCQDMIIIYLKDFKRATVNLSYVKYSFKINLDEQTDIQANENALKY